MKKLALALAMVMACSSAAMALSYDVVDVTLSGINTWVDGVYQNAGEGMKSALDNNTLKVKGSGEGWEAKAELKLNTDGAEYASNPTVTLDDVLIRIKEQPFTFEVWNWGEDGEGVDKKTPLEFVFADNASAKNWTTRLTTTIGGANTAFEIKNDVNYPDYYLFVDKKIGANTYGAAYRTFFNHRTIADGWVKADLGGAVVTAEVARQVSPVWGDEPAWAYGAIAEFPSKLTLKGYVAEKYVQNKKTVSEFDGAKDKKYIEALYNNQFRVSYSIEDDNQKNVFDVRFRQYPKGAGIGDIWVADNGYFDINVPGDNDWMQQQGIAVGMEYTEERVDSKDDIVKLYASYAPQSNISVYGRYFTGKNDQGGAAKNIVAIRGYWGLTNKLALYPRLWINSQRPTADNTNDEWGLYKDGNTVFGTFVNYKMVKGQLQAGLWFESNNKAEDKSNTTLQFGYEIGL